MGCIHHGSGNRIPYLNSDSYTTIFVKKDIYKYKFSYLPQTVKDWNKLPHSITQVKNPASFKIAVLEHLQKED